MTRFLLQLRIQDLARKKKKIRPFMSNKPSTEMTWGPTNREKKTPPCPGLPEADTGCCQARVTAPTLCLGCTCEPALGESSEQRLVGGSLIWGEGTVRRVSFSSHGRSWNQSCLDTRKKSIPKSPSPTKRDLWRLDLGGEGLPLASCFLSEKERGTGSLSPEHSTVSGLFLCVLVSCHVCLNKKRKKRKRKVWQKRRRRFKMHPLYLLPSPAGGPRAPGGIQGLDPSPAHRLGKHLLASGLRWAVKIKGIVCVE